MIDNLWGVALWALMFAACAAAYSLFNPALLVACCVWCNANKFRRR